MNFAVPRHAHLPINFLDVVQHVEAEVDAKGKHGGGLL